MIHALPRLPCLVAVLLAFAASGCAAREVQPALPPPKVSPIYADSDSQLGTAATECETLRGLLLKYTQCDAIDAATRDRFDLEADQIDIELGSAKSNKLDARSASDIAVACRKASVAFRKATAGCSR